MRIVLRHPVESLEALEAALGCSCLYQPLPIEALAPVDGEAEEVEGSRAQGSRTVVAIGPVGTVWSLEGDELRLLRM